MVVHQDYYSDARVIRYAEALAEMGVSVDVLATRKSSRSRARDRDGIRVYQIPLSRESKRLSNYYVQYALACILFTLWLLRLYAQKRYTVIHVHNMPDFLIFTALVPRLFGARLILDIHDPMPEFFMSKFGESSPDSRRVRIMRLQERWSAKLAHAVITANSSFKQNLIARGIPAAKITVVNNVADPRIFNRDRLSGEPRDDGQFRLLYPGTIAPRYGLDIAIRAMPRLIADIPTIRLRIVGPQSDHAAELADLARALGVSDPVEILPPVALEEVPELMAQADIGIYTALPDPHMNIATPSKTLEYAAMGLPIVAARLHAVEELFTADEVMFFPPGDVDAFADCILTLYQQPETRRTYAENIRSGFSQRYNWERELTAYKGALTSILPRKSGEVFSV